MSSSFQAAFDHVLQCLDAAIRMRERMSTVASSDEHMSSTKRIILRQIDRLCSLISKIHNFSPKPNDLEVMACLTRMVDVKIELHAIVDVFPEVDWAALDNAMSAAYKPLEGRQGQ